MPAKNLSYGDRRALEIGIALAAAPGVLCLDEPTSGLGREATARLSDLVRSLKGTLTIIAIEHDMEFLFGLADSIAVIHWGQVIAKGTPAELRDESVGEEFEPGQAATDARSSTTSTPTTAKRRRCSTSRLDVAQGEAVALLGPNGAGKTTTLRSMLGLNRPRDRRDRFQRRADQRSANARNRARGRRLGAGRPAAVSRR